MAAPKRKPQARKRKAIVQPQDLVYLSESQIKDIKSDISALKRMLEEDKQRVQKKITDPARVQKEIRDKKKLLEVHSPVRFKGTEANKAYKELKEIGEKIKGAMLPTREYNQMYPDGTNKELDFERAVQQQIKFQTDPLLTRLQNRFQYLARRLDPDDPMMPNIERLRG